MASQNNIVQTDQSEEALLSPKLSFSEMIIPITALVMFVILTIFIYIPQIRAGFDYKSKIAVLQEQKELLNKNIAKAEELNKDSNLVMQNLNIAELVISEELAVSDFSFDITDLAVDMGLSLQSLNSSDIAYANSSDLEFATGVIKGITGPMRFEGSFDNIVEFLEHIKLESPYLIDTSETRLRKFTEEFDRWTLDLALTGYYMVDNPEIEINSQKSIKLYTSLDTELQDLLIRSGAIEQ
jgi:hypothetical protein